MFMNPIFLFTFLLMAHALIRPFSPQHPIAEFKSLPNRTVVLIELQIYVQSFNGDWVVLDKNEPFKTDLVVESAADRDWSKLVKGGVFNAEFVGNQAKTTFFYTSASDTMHKFSFHFSNQNLNRNNSVYGADLKIYEGRANNPQAISQMDSTIRELDRQIKYASTACQEIENVLRFDTLDELEYDKIIRSSANLILFSIFFKIVATAVIMIYLNRRLKQFYITNKIAGLSK
ncbi:hypothetical protein M153_24100001350 [Pseudoloma neurophilia]|uniref:GOLD domain-containing protein n=1 Tax=Pseudoloma neurophilia TaxID=146866 RepID=A0A0R0LU90_9MICR|nr:hypothetical protein M153_24100001350 [Pseudoloma neurophilia]